LNQALIAVGWHVVRVWEYDVKHNFDACIARILNAIGRAEPAAAPAVPAPPL